MNKEQRKALIAERHRQFLVWRAESKIEDEQEAEATFGLAWAALGMDQKFTGENVQ